MLVLIWIKCKKVKLIWRKIEPWPNIGTYLIMIWSKNFFENMTSYGISSVEREKAPSKALGVLSLQSSLLSIESCIRFVVVCFSYTNFDFTLEVLKVATFNAYI